MNVAVDLTPLLPGAENGGAKIFVLSLLRQLIELTPAWHWLLLTSKITHAELALIDQGHVKRICVFPRTEGAAPRAHSAINFLRHSFAKYRSNRDRADTPLDSASRWKMTEILHELKADLLFCPFTRPLFHSPGIPTVSVIYDLQYLQYPQFFSTNERAERDSNFREAVRFSDQLVCISDFVRNSVLQNSAFPRDRIRTIYLNLAKRLCEQTKEDTDRVQSCLGLSEKQYLVYPANGWPHKNHRMLFTAFGMFLAEKPGTNAILVCTGQFNGQMQELRTEAAHMGLDSQVVFPGYLPDCDFAALLAGAKGMIFPSLYEGFGMPVLEAMAYGKPVACSNATSLPEVGGQAALYFDPRKPEQIVQSMRKIFFEPDLTNDLVQKGRARAEQFSSAELMAEQYLEVFSRSLRKEDVPDGPILNGLTVDGWTHDRITFSYGASSERRHMEIELMLPAWSQHPFVLATRVSAVAEPATYSITRGKSLLLREKLTYQGGKIEFVIEPLFQPKALKLGEDSRYLGCRCKGCWLLEGTKRSSLLTHHQDKR
ncbi:MAG: glycosyltransferase family 1 protein [Desulforhabdus sp.]|nr:glycosyltransferase family 1 protein [Desulforhabdus sp.]